MINGIINPFIKLFNEIIKDYESKIDALLKRREQSKTNYDEKVHSFCKNKYLNKCEINEDNKKENNNTENLISNYLEEIYEENNFYSNKGNIIKNKYMVNIEEEFEKN